MYKRANTPNAGSRYTNDSIVNYKSSGLTFGFESRKGSWILVFFIANCKGGMVLKQKRGHFLAVGAFWGGG